METEEDVRVRRHEENILILKNDMRCPYTSGEDWDGNCYDGVPCENPYLDLVPSFPISQNYCRQKGLPFWLMELDRKNIPLFK